MNSVASIMTITSIALWLGMFLGMMLILNSKSNEEEQKIFVGLILFIAGAVGLLILNAIIRP